MSTDHNADDVIEMPEEYTEPKLDEVALWIKKEWGYDVYDGKFGRMDSMYEPPESVTPGDADDEDLYDDDSYSDDDDVINEMDEPIVVFGTVGSEHLPPPPPPIFDDEAVIVELKKEVALINQRLPAYANQAGNDLSSCQQFAQGKFASPQQRENDWFALCGNLNFDNTWIRGNGKSAWDKDEARLQQIANQCFTFVKKALESDAGQALKAELETATSLVNNTKPQLDYAQSKIMSIGASMRNVNWQGELKTIAEQARALRDEFNQLADLSDIDRDESDTWLKEWIKNPGGGNPADAWDAHLNELDIPSSWLRGSGNSEWDSAEVSLKQLINRFYQIPEMELGAPAGVKASKSLESATKACNSNIQRLVGNSNRLLEISRDLNPAMPAKGRIVDLFSQAGAYGVEQPPTGAFRDPSEMQKFIADPRNQDIIEIAELCAADKVCGDFLSSSNVPGLAKKFTQVKELMEGAKADEAEKLVAPLLDLIPNAISAYEKHIRQRIRNLQRAYDGVQEMAQQNQDAKLDVDRAANMINRLDPKKELDSHPLLIEAEPMIKRAFANSNNVDDAKSSLNSLVGKKPKVAAKFINDDNHDVLRNDVLEEIDRTSIRDDFAKLIKSIGDPAGAIDAGERAKELVNMVLKMDDLTREVLFSNSTLDPKGLEMLINATPYRESSKMISQIVQNMSVDRREPLFMAMVQKEIDNCEDMTSFMRENEAVVRVLQQITKTSKESQKFMQDTVKTAFKAITDLEIDPKKDATKASPIKNMEVDLKALKQAFPDSNITALPPEIVQKHSEMISATLTEVVKHDPPDSVARPMAELYARTLIKFQQTGLDDDQEERSPEEQALALVGGHLILRMIAPTLQADPTEYRKRDKAQKRVATIQTKLMQSISNGVLPSEQYMQIFNDLIRSPNGGPSDLGKMIQAYLKKVVAQGENAPSAADEQMANINQPVDLEEALKPPKGLSVGSWQSVVKTLDKKEASKQPVGEIQSLLEAFEESRKKLETSIFNVDACQEIDKTLNELKQKLRGIQSDNKKFSDGCKSLVLDARAFAFTHCREIVPSLKNNWLTTPGGREVFVQCCETEHSPELVLFLKEGVEETNASDADAVTSAVNKFFDVKQDNANFVNISSRLLKRVVKAKNNYVDANDDAKENAKTELLAQWKEVLTKPQGFQGLTSDVIKRYTDRMLISEK